MSLFAAMALVLAEPALGCVTYPWPQVELAWTPSTSDPLAVDGSLILLTNDVEDLGVTVSVGGLPVGAALESLRPGVWAVVPTDQWVPGATHALTVDGQYDNRYGASQLFPYTADFTVGADASPPPVSPEITALDIVLEDLSDTASLYSDCEAGGTLDRVKDGQVEVRADASPDAWVTVRDDTEVVYEGRWGDGRTRSITYRRDVSSTVDRRDLRCLTVELYAARETRRSETECTGLRGCGCASGPGGGGLVWGALAVLLGLRRSTEAR